MSDASYASVDLTNEYLEHFGIKNMRWGVRRYQNPDGSLTPAGRLRYGVGLRADTQKEKYERAKSIAAELPFDAKGNAVGWFIGTAFASGFHPLVGAGVGAGMIAYGKLHNGRIKNAKKFIEDYESGKIKKDNDKADAFDQIKRDTEGYKEAKEKSYAIRDAMKKSGKFTDEEIKAESGVDVYDHQPVVFLSGKVKFDEEIPKEAKHEIDKMMKDGSQIVIGDAPGADTRMQDYLASKGYKSVKVYTTDDHVRNNVGDWPVEKIGHGNLTEERDIRAQKDIAMSKIADKAFAITTLDDRPDSATSKNIQRMRDSGKNVDIYDFNKKIVKKDKPDFGVNLNGKEPGTTDYYYAGHKATWNPTQLKARAKSMKAAGKTNAEIADALGVTDVSYYLYHSDSSKWYTANDTAEEFLLHWGIKGMHWGDRNYQYDDGSLTPAGRIRYGVGGPRIPGIKRITTIKNGEGNDKWLSETFKRHDDDYFKSSRTRQMRLSVDDVNEGALRVFHNEKNYPGVDVYDYDIDKRPGHDAIVNPSHTETRDMNCAYCSMAYELSRRGYDVRSKTAPYGLTNGEIADIYNTTQFEFSLIDSKPAKSSGMFGPNLNDFVRAQQNSKYFVDGSKAMDDNDINTLVNTLQSQGDGARGTLATGWIGGGGHAFNYEVYGDKVFFIDTQTNQMVRSDQLKSTSEGKAFANSHFYAADVNSFMYLRTDDKTINVSAVSKYYVENDTEEVISNFKKDDPNIPHDIHGKSQEQIKKEVEEKRKRVQNLYNSGKSYAEIAKILGISESAVGRYLNDSGGGSKPTPARNTKKPKTTTPSVSKKTMAQKTSDFIKSVANKAKKTVKTAKKGFNKTVEFIKNKFKKKPLRYTIGDDEYYLDRS